MLERPDLQDERIVAWLQKDFGAPADQVAFLLLGVERIGVHLEGCAACPIGQLRSQITAIFAAASVLIDLDVVEVLDQNGERAHKPMYLTRSAHYSRRTLLHRFAGGGSTASSLVTELNPPPADGKNPPLERMALLRTMEHIRPEQRTSARFFTAMTASAACTACRVCASVCPTKALSFEAAEGCFSLAFTPTSCTECKLCLELCAVDALHFGAPLAYDEAEQFVLLEGVRKSCKRCRTDFSGEGELCPTCAFRRRHPSGSILRSSGHAS